MTTLAAASEPLAAAAVGPLEAFFSGRPVWVDDHTPAWSGRARTRARSRLRYPWALPDVSRWDEEALIPLLFLLTAAFSERLRWWGNAARLRDDGAHQKKTSDLLSSTRFPVAFLRKGL